ncbi:MAG: MerR family transcriptional regulator [Synergistaceae bacterium]|nr:MerR family transcriptional regulator [Synergistaceae bacterium]
MAYSIKEMSELTGLPASTLRYYDKQGLLPNLRRDSNNVRIFSDEDYKTLRLIDCLKRSGLSIKDIRSFIDLARQGDKALAERRDIFTKRRENLKQELANLQEVLGVIEYKCWYYSKACEAGTESNMKNMALSEIPEEYREARNYLLGIYQH